jgi:hypothetical protein
LQGTWRDRLALWLDDNLAAMSQSGIEQKYRRSNDSSTPDRDDDQLGSDVALETRPRERAC